MNTNSFAVHQEKCTNKSPGDSRLACLVMKGPMSSRTSSIPVLAWNVSSVSLKVKMDPSAPPPLRIYVKSDV